MQRREFLKKTMASAAAVSAILGPSHAFGACPAEQAGQAFAQQLRKPRRERPLVAIVADNRGTELTDCLIPHAVLTRADIADLRIVSPRPGAITLMPALSIKTQQTLIDFETQHPQGADFVIVPAMHHDDRSGPVVEWIRRQAALGASIIGICEGAKVLGRAGLLDNRRATTHWYALASLRSTHPSMRWVADMRYVADDGVATTTGVSASLPVSLALVESLAGACAAASLASDLGVRDYGPLHDSRNYRLTAWNAWRVLSNSALFWRHEAIGVPVAEGVDGIALAFTADAWARTYRSKVIALGEAPMARTGDGVEVFIDSRKAQAPHAALVPLDPSLASAAHLPHALGQIADRYGSDTAQLVALQLEYAWEGGRSW